MKNKFILPFLLNTSIIFTFLSLIINSFFAIILIGEDINPLLNIGQNLLLLLLSLIISSIIVIILIKLKKETLYKKIKFIYFTCSLYSIIFLILNFSTMIYKNIWNIFTILILFATSLIITVINVVLPIKKTYIKAILNFIIFSIPYFIIFLCFGGFGKNNKIIITIFVYIIIYSVITVCYYLTKSFLMKLKNNNKKYYNIFK